MGVDHGGAHVLMSQQLLDRADVLAPFQQVGRKGVAEGVAAGRLRESRLGHGPLHRLLHQVRICQAHSRSALGYFLAKA